MKNISEFNIEQEELWALEISLDPVTGQRRKVIGNKFEWDKNAIVLHCTVLFLKQDGTVNENKRFAGYKVYLTCYNNSNGPFIDPSTGDVVLPDANNEVPSDSKTRFSAIVTMSEDFSIFKNIVLGFKQSADSNGEFDI